MTSSRGTGLPSHSMRRGWALVAVAAVGLGAMALGLHGDGFRPRRADSPFAVPVVGVQSPAPWEAPAFAATSDAVGPRLVVSPFSSRVSPEHAGVAHWVAVTEYARRYRIGLGLASTIYRVAREQRIDPDLAFRIVRLESKFVPDVVSYAGAVGLTQLMPGTARFFQPGVTAEELLDPETNLRIGFRYLRVLVKEFRGDLKLALLTYNRGPVAVYAALDAGEDPANGYDRVVLRGYVGRGVTD